MQLHFPRTMLVASLVMVLWHSSETRTIPASPVPDNPKPVKNLIILIPDGCGTAHMAAARILKHAPLAQDSMHCGLVMTYSANSLVTGSSAAASAFATGWKAWEDKHRARCLSIVPDSVLIPEPRRNPEEMIWRPAATILEAARDQGRETGIVVTCNINHATPAGFSAHWHDRDDGNVLTLQQVFQGFDVILAGGYGNLIPISMNGGKRTDGANLVSVLTSRGYSMITDAMQLESLPASSSRIWGAFANDHFMHALDAQAGGKNEPSLASRTKIAIDHLRHAKKGFVLIVEGSQVDWASHDNDPVGVVTEYLAFDSAVSVALDFARSTGNTEVLVFPDHDNGGMSVSSRGDDCTSTPYGNFAKIDSCTMTCGGLFDSLVSIARLHGSIDITTVTTYLGNVLHLRNLSDDDRLFSLIDTITAIAKGEKKRTNDNASLLGAIFSKRVHIGWTTNGHTGSNVPMFSYLLQNEGTFNNTDIARYCAAILRVDLHAETDRLFTAAPQLFTEAGGYAITVDTTGLVAGSGSMAVKKGENTALFPFNRDYFTVESDTVALGGITVYSKMNGTVYLPAAAKKLVAKKLPKR